MPIDEIPNLASDKRLGIVICGQRDNNKLFDSELSKENDVLVRAILDDPRFIYPQISNLICPPAFHFLNPSFIPNIS
jgi:hypothetical protein